MADRHDWTLSATGTDTVIIRFAQHIDPQLTPFIRAACHRLRTAMPEEITDLVPSYCSIMVCYNLLRNDFDSIAEKIHHHLQDLTTDTPVIGPLVEVPVCYHPDFGPDLQRVAQYHQISIDQVIERHAGNIYQVYSIGFAPGFAYMGNVAESLSTPRLATPRQRVPAGSVAIADQQTAIYPLTTPGGWNLLGQTPVKMFNRDLAQLCPLNIGDRVRFYPISKKDFLAAINDSSV